MKVNVKTLLSASALLCGFAFATAHAQIGSGWTSYSPGYKTQIEGCGWNSGLEFKLTCSYTYTQNSNYQRAERRYDNITASQSQFQGTVVVNSLGGDRICLKQTFQQNNGPWNMIAISKSGYLYEVSNGNKLANYSVGSSMRINTITNTSNGTVDVYMNGSHVEQLTGGVNPLYDKFGTYRTHSGYGPVTATFSGIQFWKK